MDPFLIGGAALRVLNGRRQSFPHYTFGLFLAQSPTHIYLPRIQSESAPVYC